MWDRGAGSRSIDRFESGAWRRGALLFHFFPERNEARVQLRSCCIFRTAARADNQVDAGQLMLVLSERLADDSAEPVSLDTAARGTNRNCETETRPTFVVPESCHPKESISKPAPASISRIKVSLATQAALRWERKPWWGLAIGGQGSVVLLDRGTRSEDAITENATEGNSMMPRARARVPQPGVCARRVHTCWRFSSGPAGMRAASSV